MILPIYLYGQPVLRREAEDVPKDYPELKTLIDNMFETLLQAEGCGLAAPQVGLGLRLFIVDGTELKEEYPECTNFKQPFINPEILGESEEKVLYSEGCLSLPGISENVLRPKTIRVRYYDADFVQHEEELTGFCARIFEHEFDHLQGNVFTDRISPIRRQFVSSKLQKIAKGKTIGKYKCKMN